MLLAKPALKWSLLAGNPTGAASGPFLVARYFSAVNACAAGVASCFFEPRFSLSRYLTTMRRCSRIRRPRLSRCRYTFTPAPSSTARTNPGLQQLRGAQAAERHDYLGRLVSADGRSFQSLYRSLSWCVV